MRHVLITGGSDGIGLAVARLLAAAKDTRVTLVARNEANLREAVTKLPGRVSAAPGAVTRERSRGAGPGVAEA